MTSGSAMQAKPTPIPAELDKEDLLSLRVPVSVAREFRMEAVRRGMRQNAMFEEMWRVYLKESGHGAP